jgi:hypothetical protein
MQGKVVVILFVFLLGAAAGGTWMYLRPVEGVAPPDGDDVYRIVNPLAQVEVGEWALYRKGDNKTMRLEVIGVHPATKVVTIREDIRDEKTNAPVSSNDLKVGPNHFLWGFDSAGALVARIYEDPVTVAGRTFDAFCVETSARSMGPVRHWYSPDVPVIGLIRQERVEEGPYSVLAELVDWSGRQP